MELEKHISCWSSPANIALIKYWGKKYWQLPLNPSVSMTLSKSQTMMEMSLHKKDHSHLLIDCEFLFDNKENEKFKLKIVDFFKNVLKEFPWLCDYKIAIKTSNTFPHSSGIASSASSMSALALNLMTLDQKLNKFQNSNHDFFRESSICARKASGSASRSIYSDYVLWGHCDDICTSSDEFAVPLSYNDYVHPEFQNWCDTIVIISAQEKGVSSRAGHSLMENHPFSKERYSIARNRLHSLLESMKVNDLEKFIEIVEGEALMLHALMMTSNPSYLLLQPNSIYVIEEIKKMRNQKGIPICFTIDAGPNIHILYPSQYQNYVMSWCREHNNQFEFIHDKVGSGPINLLTRN